MLRKVLVLGTACTVLLTGAVFAQDNAQPASSSESPEVSTGLTLQQQITNAANDDARIELVNNALIAANGDATMITSILEQAKAAGMSEDTLLALAVSNNVSEEIIAAVLPNTQTAAQGQAPGVITLPPQSANNTITLPTTPGAGGGAGGGGATISRN